MSTSAFMLSDVVTDAILVERSKLEPHEKRGGMQAIGYSVRFVGRWENSAESEPALVRVVTRLFRRGGNERPRSVRISL